MRKGKRVLLAGIALATALTSACNGFGFNGEKESNVTMKLIVPNGEVFPYIDSVKAYLQAEVGANVRDYLVRVDNPNQPIRVEWSADGKVANYKVEYATLPDYSNAILLEYPKETTDCELFNLYKATKYYVRVTAFAENGETLAVEEGSFETTSLGPRVMKIPDIHNVRDVGGYQTSTGQTTVQGLVYRGGTLMPADVYNSELTDEGKAYMSDVMGIKTEIDFRGMKESGGFTESVIPGATLHYATLSGYDDAFTGPTGYKATFQLLADKNNYPIYYHCTGGANRTGTVTFLLNAMLGVSEWECVQDYEVTSFSLYGERNSQSGTYSSYFKRFRDGLESYGGETLQEKAIKYLLSIGVTAEEISSIQAIMFGEI